MIRAKETRNSLIRKIRRLLLENEKLGDRLLGRARPAAEKGENER
jgi:hypothetical protein